MNAHCTEGGGNTSQWGHNTCHTSPRSVESHNILYQNARVYIKIHINVPLVLRISARESATLFTLLLEVLKVI